MARLRSSAVSVTGTPAVAGPRVPRSRAGLTEPGVDGPDADAVGGERPACQLATLDSAGLTGGFEAEVERPAEQSQREPHQPSPRPLPLTTAPGQQEQRRVPGSTASSSTW